MENSILLHVENLRKFQKLLFSHFNTILDEKSSFGDYEAMNSEKMINSIITNLPCEII
jgi:hypothetical protein